MKTKNNNNKKLKDIPDRIKQTRVKTLKINQVLRKKEKKEKKKRKKYIHAKNIYFFFYRTLASQYCKIIHIPKKCKRNKYVLVNISMYFPLQNIFNVGYMYIFK